MKKKIIFLCFAIVATINGFGQKKAWVNPNPNIYDSRGQYLQSYPADSEKGFAQVDAFVLNNNFYPRLTLSGFSIYDSNFGIYCSAEISRTRNAGFTEKGYAISEEMSVGVSAALSYYLKKEYFDERFFFLGFGCVTHKAFIGPVAGFMLHNEKWSLESYGQYAVYSNFLKHYKAQGVKYFDPNSWYKIELLRKFGGYFAAGIYSERFYLSGLIFEVEVSDLENFFPFKIKAYAGQDFVTNNFAFGLAMKVTTLDK